VTSNTRLESFSPKVPREKHANVTLVIFEANSFDDEYLLSSNGRLFTGQIFLMAVKFTGNRVTVII